MASSHGPSGESMPVGDEPGWTQVLAEDFSTPVSSGGFPGPYAHQWMTYDQIGDTWDVALYDKNVVTAHDGLLDINLHTASDGRPRGAAPIPLIDGKWGGQTYGKYSVRMRSDYLEGYGMAFLLWDDDNVWANGEIDFPEGGTDGTAVAYNHVLGNPSELALKVDSGVTFDAWHTYTIEWTPTAIRYLLDDRLVATATDNIPTTPMHWVLQTATTGATPDPSTNGHLQIDWATQYRYTP